MYVENNYSVQVSKNKYEWFDTSDEAFAFAKQNNLDISKIERQRHY